jgi:hypothetical protein
VLLLSIGGERSGWSHSHLFLDAFEFFPKFGIIALELLHSPCCPFNLGSVRSVGVSCGGDRLKVGTYDVAFSCFALMISLRAMES